MCIKDFSTSNIVTGNLIQSSFSADDLKEIILKLNNRKPLFNNIRLIPNMMLADNEIVIMTSEKAYKFIVEDDS